MTHRFPIAAIAALTMTAIAAVHAHAQDVVLLPQVTGSIRYLPQIGLLEPAPVGGLIESTWWQLNLLEFRRGFAEFQIPAFETSVQKATLVLTETRGTISDPVPPDTHELSYYAADLAVSVEDYDRPTTPNATFQTDNNEPTGVFTFDVTAVLAQFRGKGLGFRVKLTCDPQCGGGAGGSAFGELATIPPRIEVTFGEPALTVPLDIKPSSCPNLLNLGSRGVLPAAILGTDAVDAHDIDPASIRLVGVAPLRTDFEDVGAPGTGEPCTASGPDGLLDLALKFDTRQLVAAITSALGRPPADREVLTLSLSGQLKDGTPIEGTDVVIALGTMD
ncbi:MAG TPA: hypothetical protein VEW47_17175 [Candidatus Dormibacteraeota bacterium]|nr:hypothetical protein [Candidatus Dormibacteraeota bacterium]